MENYLRFKKKFLDVFQTSEVMFYSEKDCILQNFALSKSQKFRGQGSKFPQEGMVWSHSKLSKWISKPSEGLNFPEIYMLLVSIKGYASVLQDLPYSITNLKFSIKHSQASLKGIKGNESMS